MKTIIARADGGVSILTCAKSTDAAAEVEKWKTSAPGQYVSHRMVDDAEVPTDRTFRNAWRSDLSIDMPAAREIHRATLRRLRVPVLASLDTAYLRADELDDRAGKQRIVARKQALRDMPLDPAIDAAVTPDALKAVMPAALTE